MNFQTINASSSPEDQMNENFETIDFVSVYGKRHPDTTGLTWAYYGGRWGGNSITAGTVTLTNAATNYLVVNRVTGVLSTSTTSTNWDNTTEYARVYKLTTAGSVVTATEDHRAGPYGIFAPQPAYTSVTPVGNVGAGEDDLITYTMLANQFNTSRDSVHVIAWGLAANNANAKTVKLYFGSAVILTTALTANQDGVWRIEADIVAGSGSPIEQQYIAQLLQGGTTTLIDVERGTTAQDQTATITIKCTGEATSNNDIVQSGLIVEFRGG